MKLKLEMSLDNAAYQTESGTVDQSALLETLIRTAQRMVDLPPTHCLDMNARGKVYDVNGNQVGNWKVTR